MAVPSRAATGTSKWRRSLYTLEVWTAILIIPSDGEDPPHFHPEFGRFMLEATPGRPWGIGFKDLLKVESNMKWR